MAKDKKAKMSKNQKKAARLAKERAEKREAKKGNGAFPDLLIVTKQKDKDGGKSWFLGHDGDDLSTLYKDGEVVGVYKLRRASTMSITRKVAR